MKYQIIKPIDSDWNTFGKVLRDIQFDTRQIMNKTIQLCWEWHGFSADYKAANEVYPKARDILGYSGIDGYCYDKLKSVFTKHNTGNLTTSINKAVQRWKTDLKEIILGNKSIASFRSNVPIDLHNKSISLTKDGSNYYADLSLASKTYKNELQRKSGQFRVLINEGDKSSKVILDRCINGIYKVSASQIVMKDRKWLLYLAYTFSAVQNNIDSDTILGIDMGIKYPVYMAIYGTPIRTKIDGGEIESFRKQVEKRRFDLQRQGRYCGDGRKGHGIKTRIKPIESEKAKISNFRNTVNHKYSRYIIDFAIKYNCGMIQMEDLSGISTDNRFLKNWTYYDLQQKIKYKAEEVGIQVKMVKPHYTSQRCSKCGYIDKENRPEQEVFECKSCGFRANADYNAALNIATPNIDNLILESVKKCEI